MARRGVILVGASTGAPRSHHVYLQQMPKDVSVPIVLVQHMPAGPFIHGVMRYLETCSDVRCKLLNAAATLEPRTFYVIEPGLQMRFTGGYAVQVEREPDKRKFSPAMNITFPSAARAFGSACVVMMLAGLHADIDGLEGCRAVRGAGGRVLATTRETTSCYSMIEQLRRGGQCDGEAPLPDIALAAWQHLRTHL